MSASPMVDLLFEAEGDTLDADYAWALCREVAGILPWLESEPGAGVHPLKGAPTDRGTLLLSRRSRLILRLPAARVPEAERLTGSVLDIAGAPLRVGASRVRELVPFATLYARFVATGSGEEQAFVQDVAALLKELDTRCKFMCGKSRRARIGEDEIAGFSVMLHEVLLDESVELQQRGLGGGRMLGCGMLVPHKSIRAVRREQ
ncbi:MAG TPA: type I-MYXAN CRISPR-associated protein Cas6/Cmx6 [Burkholderiales bacterium]|nr:type I-MYXAN CRISPR-associated protein Cas6/Cmx6 [Burkholderiales bacterium]